MQIIGFCIAVLYDVRSKRMRLSCADVRAIRCALRFLGTSIFLKASCMNLHGVSMSDANKYLCQFQFISCINYAYISPLSRNRSYVYTCHKTSYKTQPLF